jgi:hypothetical protein
MTAIAADIAAHLSAPELSRFRLPAAALAAIAEKLGHRVALEFASRSEDLPTKAAGVAMFNATVTRGLALMKDPVNASSEDERRRVKKRLDRALAEVWATALVAGKD